MYASRTLGSPKSMLPSTQHMIERGSLVWGSPGVAKLVRGHLVEDHVSYCAAAGGGIREHDAYRESDDTGGVGAHGRRAHRSRCQCGLELQHDRRIVRSRHRRERTHAECRLEERVPVANGARDRTLQRRVFVWWHIHCERKTAARMALSAGELRVGARTNRARPDRHDQQRDERQETSGHAFSVATARVGGAI